MTEINLEAIDASSLTPKQRKVYQALKRGKTPVEIAETMKISTAGVYGHIRHLRAAEHDGTGVSGNGNAVKALVTEGGYEQAVQVLDASLENETAELQAAEQRLEELQSQIQQVGELRDVRSNRVTALQAARGSLDAKLIAA